MNSVTGGHAGDLWLRIVLSALVFAACVLGVRAAVAGIRSRRSRQLAQLQEEQLLQKMAQFTMRRRLAEILDEGPPPNKDGPSEESREIPDPGTPNAGIPWREGSVVTTVTMKAPPRQELSDVELLLSFDAMFIHAAQISNVPNVVLTPMQKQVLSSWKGGDLDKATAEDVQLLNSYPAQSFLFKSSVMSSDSPITLVFVGGNDSQLGNFTIAVDAQWFPRSLKIEGQYKVQHDQTKFTIPVMLEAHQS